jgi:hypothetical protein
MQENRTGLVRSDIMQTQRPESETIETQSTPSSIPPRRRHRWLAGLGALLVVGLVIASSIVVFSLAGKSHGPGNQGKTPPTGQWKAVQHGYLFLSMSTAASDPAVLYACATTSAVVSNQGTTGVVTILRSADSGDSWQNIGANLLQGGACQVAVNPANSGDVYVFSGGNSAQAPAVLHHTTDGGKTWLAIQPSLAASSIHATQRVFLQQLQFAGNSLLAIDWSIRLLPIASPPGLSLYLPRLVRSTDGGHNWTTIDDQFNAQGLGAQSYAVDPTQPNTIYELLGHPWLPVERVPPDGSFPFLGINQQLYKTTDGGAHWALALAQAPYGSSVQLAANHPATVYVGGVLGPLPLGAQPAQGTATTLPVAVGGFHLEVSRDGGATWKTAATPPNQGSVVNWFASADGRVFVSPTTPFTSPGVSGTAVIVGTAVVGTAVPVPPLTPQSGSSRPPSGGTPVSGTTHSVPSSSADVAPPPGKSYIMSYDPASDSWSKVTTPPDRGALLAVTTVTAASAHGGAALWFMGSGTTGTTYTLYRYIV